MSIPKAAQDLIDTRLQVAVDTSDAVVADGYFNAVRGMLDYALAVGHITPLQFSDHLKLVDLNRKRRTYKPLN